MALIFAINRSFPLLFHTDWQTLSKRNGSISRAHKLPILGHKVDKEGKCTSDILPCASQFPLEMLSILITMSPIFSHQTNIFAFDKVFIPCHLPGHWTLGV